MNKETMRQAIVAYLNRIPMSELSLGYPRRVAETLRGEPYEPGTIVTSDPFYKEVFAEMQAMRVEKILNYYSHAGWYVVGGTNDRGAKGHPVWGKEPVA